MEKDSHPKTILVTGGSSGIGAAIARKFANENWRSAIVDIQEPEKKREGQLYCQTDISRAKDIDGMYVWTKEKLGVPQVLVINAGKGIREKLTEGDPEKWQEVINTNLMGALRCIRAFVPEMMERKSGNIVFISSVAAQKPHEYGGVYAASKAGLEVVAETLRLETIPYLDITVVSPGITETGFFEKEISGHTSVEELQMGSLSPEDIAEDIFYAVCKKRKGSCINKIVTRPIKQNF